MTRTAAAIGQEMVVQGFRKGGGMDAYVYIGVVQGDDVLSESLMAPEAAHTLSEYIRQEAEFANQRAEEDGE